MRNTEWVVPCNPTVYDLDSEMSQSDTVYWRQNARFEVGDIVYIYLSKGVGEIRYKMTVSLFMS